MEKPNLNELELNMRELKPTTVEKLRTHVQLAILLLDKSGSTIEMAKGNVTKAEAIAMATEDFIRRLLASRRSVDFALGIVKFDHSAYVHLPITFIEGESGTRIDADQDFFLGSAGGTNFMAAFELGYEMATEWMRDSLPPELGCSVTFVLLSDGETMTDAQEIADRINFDPRMKIEACILGLPGQATHYNVEQMKAIAGAEERFHEASDAETIRKFFDASLSI